MDCGHPEYYVDSQTSDLSIQSDVKDLLWYPNSRSGSSNLEVGVDFEANAR